MLTIKQFIFNPFQVNTYVISDNNHNCIIIDAACYEDNEQQQIIRHIDENHLNPLQLLYTHGHIDHMMGHNFLQQQYKIESCIHESELFLIQNASQFAAMFGLSVDSVKEPDYFISEHDSITLGAFTFKIIQIPGHSPGSLLFYQPEEKVLFSGDVLFNGSIGRSDLPGGNHNELIIGIKEKLMPLADDIKVYPGHGELTTIGDERRMNPFIS